MADLGIYLNVATFIALVGGIIKLTLGAAKMQAELRKEATGMRQDIDRKIDDLARAGLDRAETLRHEFGETGNSLRTKIHEIETWNRDTFVRKDSFEMVIGRLEKSIEKIGDRIDDRFERLSKKIDSQPD